MQQSWHLDHFLIFCASVYLSPGVRNAVLGADNAVVSHRPVNANCMWCSQAFTHPSNNHSQGGLRMVIGWNQYCNPWIAIGFNRAKNTEKYFTLTFYFSFTSLRWLYPCIRYYNLESKCCITCHVTPTSAAAVSSLIFCSNLVIFLQWLMCTLLVRYVQ